MIYVHYAPGARCIIVREQFRKGFLVSQVVQHLLDKTLFSMLVIKIRLFYTMCKTRFILIRHSLSRARFELASSGF